MSKLGKKIAVIPDTQVRPGDDIGHLIAAGNYIKDKQPDYIVHLGDHWDFESLSSWDKGKPRLMEGRRLSLDFEAGNYAMEALNNVLGNTAKGKRYILRGNHEDRLTRAIDENPQLLESIVGEKSMKSPGWKVIPYKEMLKLEGITFAHYFYHPKTGKPYSGKASTMLEQVGFSYVQGHRQSLDTAIKDLADGTRRRGLIAGSFHAPQAYLGPQASKPWMGILILHKCRDGDYNLMEVDMEYLLEEWSS